MEEKLDQLICEAFNAELEQLDPSLELRDLEEWDSMAHMQFILALEEEFDFELTGDEIASIETIEQVRNMILKKTREKA